MDAGSLPPFYHTVHSLSFRAISLHTPTPRGALCHLELPQRAVDPLCPTAKTSIEVHVMIDIGCLYPQEQRALRAKIPVYNNAAKQVCQSCSVVGMD